MQQKSATTSAATVVVDLVAENFKFDKKNISVPSGAQILMHFDNRDDGVKHNFSLYKDKTAAETLFLGKVIAGPAKIDYSFTAPAEKGRYFFRCDIHPRTMTGTLEVK